MKERANGYKFKSCDDETAINVVNAQTESEPWAPASAGMTDRDLACTRFRRNLVHITIKGYWVLNFAIQFLLIAIGFFLGSNSFPNLNAGNVPLSSFLTGPRV
jgi:hypothetical protein